VDGTEQRVNKSEEVWRQLATVVDPELDESVTEMNFISRVDVDAADCVHVDFRLPTYWCAANFAFLMADDMRTAVRSLPWVKDTKIVLGEHMYADKINHGVERGLSFEESFGDEANGNLDDVRRTFLVKAFQRRQEALINHVIARGTAPEDICAMTIAELQRLPLDAEGQKLVARYMERRGMIEQFADVSPAFISAEVQRLEPGSLSQYMGGLRRVRANAEFNGAMCRGLLEARFDTTTPLVKKNGQVCHPRPVAVQS
jgi:metal-sulfur cluster biosynthetic enzyme